MQQFNFPTTILYGEGAVDELARRIRDRGLTRLLLVTDSTLVRVGPADRVRKTLAGANLDVTVFDGVHPNPVEADVEASTEAFRQGGCEAIVALGGGSPMDVAKTIKIAATHPGPLAQYDDALGGDARIVHPMPPLFAIPTTAGTGSEVGRSSVIVMRETGRKTIFFHPRLMPEIAALAPELTVGLPPGITAATGLDAFTHCLEAYFATGFHPLADGIALEGIRLILNHLPTAVARGADLEARGRMLIAASMGATAFQKGLGMTHSLAHPLSTRYGMHHGLANALLVPVTTAFLEEMAATADHYARLARVQTIFHECGYESEALSDAIGAFVGRVGIELGLGRHGVREADLEDLSKQAFADPCHQLGMVPVTREILLTAYRAAL